MRALAIAFVLAVAPIARAEDPLHSAACDAARSRLEEALDAAARRRENAREQVEAARRAAAEACLGHASGNPQRTGAPYPPISVPGPVMTPPGIQTAPPRAASPSTAPRLEISRPVVITTCDPGGCWDSEGRRLSNAGGPLLVGPQGVCIVQPGAVQCPR